MVRKTRCFKTLLFVIFLTTLVVGSVGTASTASDTLFTYTGDVLPSADGWMIVNYPSYESTGAHIECGILHFTDFSSGSGSAIDYRREWPVSPDCINVAEFVLRSVSCSELDGMIIGTNVGDYNMYYIIFPDRIQSEYRDYARVEHLGDVYYFDTTSQFNTYKAIIEDGRAKLYINGTLVLNQSAGLGIWNLLNLSVVEFGSASSPATAEAYFDEVRAYTVCSSPSTKAPILTPIGHIALVSILLAIAAVAIVRKRR